MLWQQLSCLISHQLPRNKVMNMYARDIYKILIIYIQPQIKQAKEEIKASGRGGVRTGLHLSITYI
jgi:hypothetical protein